MDALGTLSMVFEISFLLGGGDSWMAFWSTKGGGTRGGITDTPTKKRGNHVETVWRCGNVACMFQDVCVRQRPRQLFGFLVLYNRYRCRSLNSLQEIEGGHRQRVSVLLRMLYMRSCCVPLVRRSWVQGLGESSNWWCAIPCWLEGLKVRN